MSSGGLNSSALLSAAMPRPARGLYIRKSRAKRGTAGKPAICLGR